MSTSSLGLYLAVDMDLKAYGLDSGNWWLAGTLDAEATYQRIARPDVIEASHCPGLFLTCTTLKDPTIFDGRHHVLEAFTFVPYEVFSSMGDRPPAYEALKGRLASQMIDLIEATLLPGLREKIVFQSISTPLTNQQYCAGTGGAMYGTAKIRSQIGPWSFGMKSPLDGLWLCGASVLGHGAHGASLSGVAVAAKMLGARPQDVLATKRAELTVLPADDTRAWPVELTRAMTARQQARATA
jgi:phytoene dehydrogenase-like protein